MIEPLLLNFNLSLLISNIWTWLAVMTAAVGFWRIRSLKPESKPDQKPSPVQATEPDRTVSILRRPAPYENEVVSSPTKGNKYRASYNYCMHQDEDELEERENGGGAVTVVEEWRCKSAPAAEMWWYRYQDRRVLDGSVVRLWDSSTTKTRYIHLGL